MKTVGAITIGQTPRDDVAGEIEKVLGPGFRVVQAGALDGLGRTAIDALAPTTDADALITRLRDGADVIVAKSRIVPRLQACLDRLEGEADASVILCAGVFPPFRTTRPLLMPERCMSAMVDAVFDGRRLGVIVPIPQQRESYALRWSRVDPGVTVVVASPYEDSTRLVSAAEELRRAGVSLVVMECMGFTSGMKQIVRDVTGAPALLPASVLSRFLAEIAS
jgi:protein AroM